MRTIGREIFQFFHNILTILLPLSTSPLEFRPAQNLHANLLIRRKQWRLISSPNLCFPKVKRYLHPFLILFNLLDKTLSAIAPNNSKIYGIFCERLWRSLKYEEVYLQDYQRVPEDWKSANRLYWTPKWLAMGSSNNAGVQNRK